MPLEFCQSFLTRGMMDHGGLTWLQAEYAVLQKKYRAIKQQRMEELESLMTEQQQRVMLLTVHMSRLCKCSCHKSHTSSPATRVSAVKAHT